MKGSASTTFTLPGAGPPVTETVDERIKWFGTVRARLGYLPTDNLLTYVTGGFAYGRVDRSGSYVNNSALGILGTIGGFSFFCSGGQTCAAGSSSETATGWTVGGGLEYAFWQKWTVKAEYLYVSLESTSVTEIALTPVPGTLPSSFNANSRTNFNVARVGVNYRF
jgi:outer membrane immunogenic protein